MRFLIFLLLVLSACSKNPVTGKSELHLMSEEQEIALGKQNYGYMQQAQGGPYVADPRVEKYVQKVGLKLSEVSDRPHLPYEFMVLDSSTPNAWALPGGKIVIYRGLLNELKSEAELAAVLSHEIVHSAARHGAKSLEKQLLMQMGLVGLAQVLQGHQYEDLIVGSAQVGGGLIHLKYSRHAELEADQYGIKYMVAAGYDPEAAVELQRTFLRLSKENKTNWLSGLFSTHPPSQERIEANEKTTAQYPKGGFIGKEEYQKEIGHLKEMQPAYEALDNGYLALLKGKYSEALRLAEQGIQIEPKEAHLCNLAGKAENFLHHTQNALAHFERAVELNPDYFDFLLQLGLIEHKLHRNDHAKARLEKSVKLLPTAEGHYALGEIALEEGDITAARYHFRIAAEVDKNAANELRFMDAPENPERFLDVEGSWSGNKNLILTINNKSNYTWSNVIVEAFVYNTNKKLILHRKLQIPGSILAKDKLSFTTSIKRPSDAVWIETCIKQAKIYH
jgi:predicted Zn-dependent protease